MWYVADATPEAGLFVGLKRGVTRAGFEEKIADGTVADCFHRIPVQPGDVMFLPSGRVHALGAGSVLFEIQQHSDTTYRVFDWNRTGLDGKPRDLHIAQSLASIDFNDFEPPLIRSAYSRNPLIRVRYLVNDPLFTVDACEVKRGERFYLRSASLQIIGLLRGRLKISHAKSGFRRTFGEIPHLGLRLAAELRGERGGRMNLEGKFFARIENFDKQRKCFWDRMRRAEQIRCVLLHEPAQIFPRKRAVGDDAHAFGPVGDLP